MVDCFEVGKLKNRIIMVCRWQIDFSGLKRGACGLLVFQQRGGWKKILKGNGVSDCTDNFAHGKQRRLLWNRKLIGILAA